MKVLVVYGTTEGHTRLIALKVGDWIRERFHEVNVVDSAALPEDLQVAMYDAFVVLGSLHMMRHQASIAHFVQEHLWSLNKKPSVFVSASLTAVKSDDQHQAEAQACIDTFLEQTGWSPTLNTPVAGALLYTKYDWLRRMALKAISGKEGGDTDTSKDYEYTDWTTLKSFIDAFIDRFVS